MARQVDRESAHKFNPN